MLFPWSGAADGEADTTEAAARQPPDVLEKKTAANDTQAESLTWRIKLSDEAGPVLHEAVACPMLTHRLAR